MRLGKVRLGKKGDRGQPEKLSTFRFTSASQALLEAVAAKWGGQVGQWTGAPEEGYYEVMTETAELPIVLPPVFSDADGTPTLAYSQFFELWSAGGCQRRCDGETESLSGKPCLCEHEKRECKITTRLNFMLPDIPGLGVWNLESHWYNAAVELPGTLDLLQLAAAEGQLIPATLRAEQRTSKQDGQTLRYIVPVLDFGASLADLGLVAGEGARALNMPQPADRSRPALPVAGVPTPQDTPFENDRQPDWGEPSPLPETAEELEARDLRLLTLQLVEGLGADVGMWRERIDDNRLKHGADGIGEHLTWLRGQKTRAENQLAAMTEEAK
jgi:hypothetical protein